MDTLIWTIIVIAYSLVAALGAIIIFGGIYEQNLVGAWGLFFFIPSFYFVYYVVGESLQ